MRLLADENFPRQAVEGLRQANHDVLWIRTHSPGIPDESVLLLAVAESRLILTFDKGFGELAFRFRLPAQCGIVLFRCAPASPERITNVVLAALRSIPDFRDHFAVIEENRIRMTPLPHNESIDN